MHVMNNVDVLSKSVADCIDGTDPALARMVKKAIMLSNFHGYIFHGIKRNADFRGVHDNGILPLTPEGASSDGNSFWCSGARTFSSGGIGRGLDTYDTAFFHYAHSFDPRGPVMYMTMEVAKWDDIPRDATSGKQFEKDGYITLAGNVPRDKIELLRVEADLEGMNMIPREKARHVEKMLLEQMVRTVQQGYTPGGMRLRKDP